MVPEPPICFVPGANKVRVIDDAKQSAVNAAYTSTIKLRLQDVDYVAAMCIALFTQAKKAGVDPAHGWVGRTFDLSKAI